MSLQPIPILHIITGLNTGGAEMMLYKLLAARDPARFRSTVVSLAGCGTIGPRIEELGIPVYALNLPQDAHQQTWDEVGQRLAAAGSQLARIVRDVQPRLVEGWMYHGNLFSSAAALLAPGYPPVVWNVQQSLYDIKAEKPLTQIVVRANAALSFQPRAIIYNSLAGAVLHEQAGFRASKRRFIPNGYDCDRFRPQADAHGWLCQSLGLPADSILVGLVGRYHDMKDHRNLVEAAGRLAPQAPNVHFVLAGRDVTPKNAVLQQQIAAAQVSSRFHLLGERSDIPRLMAGLDILASSSWTEGAANVIGEAMACGVPCVVTDVGDSAAAVGETGIVVPPRDPKGLAAALAILVAADKEHRQRLGRQARQRVLELYSLPQVVRQYDALYTELTADGDLPAGTN